MSGRHRMPSGPRHARGRHRHPTHRAHWVGPVLVTAVVLGAGGGESAFTGAPKAPQRPVPFQPVTGAPSPTSTPTPTVRPPKKPRPQPPALVLAVSGPVSWVEVTGPHGQLLVSGLVRHGRRLTFHHAPLHVVLGNAGAVRVSRHGHASQPAGRPGEVVQFTVR